MSFDRFVRRACVMMFSLLLALAVIPAATAQEGPPNGRHVTILNPYAAGGLSYELAQIIGERLKKLFDISVVVEARPGGNTITGTMSVLKSKPDGHTLLINTASVVSITGSIYKRPPYDPAKDFVPVAFVATAPLVLVVHSELPVTSIADLKKLAAATPGGLSYASIGAGSAQHLSGEFLKRELAIDMTHVPFAGPTPALTAVAGGHVALMFIDVLNALSLVEAGKVRPIAMTNPASSGIFQGVPTFADASLNGFDFDLRFGIFAPAQTPAEIVALLNSRIRTATADAAVHARFNKRGVHVTDTPGPEEIAKVHARELVRWQRLVKDANLDGSQ
jgi:tripartite-type tricarboxylate transporter receptor subunit TctC